MSTVASAPGAVRRVALVGFMGAGKTTVGRALARRWGWRFVDVDTWVETQAGCSVSAIFAAEGEASFRERESAALRALLASDDGIAADGCVVACGGGAVLDGQNRALLRAGHTLWLDASIGATTARVGRGRQSRPLASGDDWEQRLAELFKTRRPLYETFSAGRVDADRPLADVVAHCEALVPNREAYERPAASSAVELDSRRYEVRTGPGAIDDLSRAIAHAVEGSARSRRAVVVTDRWLQSRHAARVVEALRADGWTVDDYALPTGEAAKSLESVSDLWGYFVRQKLDRGAVVVAVGGGTVGDAAGFAASTFHRGMPLVHVPTTLLAQVDSAIGGKTAINHPQAKNAIGSFYQPRLVLGDIDFLDTLHPRDLQSGLAEAVKTALLFDAEWSDELHRMWPWLVSGCSVSLADAVARSAQWKCQVVTRDEQEGAGLRHLLNLGHTLGHALESATGYGVLRHGEAVTWGMRAALWLSERLGVGTPDALAPAHRLLSALKAPRCPGLDPTELIGPVSYDKKALHGAIRFVLLERPGSAHLQLVSPEDLRAAAAWMVRAVGARGRYERR